MAARRRLTFFYRKREHRQVDFLEAFQAAAKLHGDICEPKCVFDGQQDDDGMVLFGYSDVIKPLYDQYSKAGKLTVLVDKGYTNRKTHFRVSVNAFQPLAYMYGLTYPNDEKGYNLAPYKKGGDVILFDGANDKFTRWNDLGDAHPWAQEMVYAIKQRTRLPIVYRPRVSRRFKPKPIKGAELSNLPLADDLTRARIAVSWGGNFGLNAVCAGVPHFALGGSVALSVSETNLSWIDVPYIPSDIERQRWLRAVLSCQFSFDQFRDGTTWQHIKNAFEFLALAGTART